WRRDRAGGSRRETAERGRDDDGPAPPCRGGEGGKLCRSADRRKPYQNADECCIDCRAGDCAYHVDHVTAPPWYRLSSVWCVCIMWDAPPPRRDLPGELRVSSLVVRRFDAGDAQRGNLVIRAERRPSVPPYGPRPAGRRDRDRGPEQRERQRHHDEERREPAPEPVQGREAAGRGDDQPRQAGEDRPEEPARPLRGEVERQPEPEEAVRWSDDPQIGAAGREHVGLRAEETDPGPGKERGQEADRLGDHGGGRGADPRDTLGARPLTGAVVRPHHRDE